MPRARKDWTPEQVADALALVEAHGTDGIRIFAQRTGRHPEAVRVHLQAQHTDSYRAAMFAFKQARIALRVAMGAAVPERDPFEWVERFRPVAIPAPQRPRASVQPTTGLTMVAGDMHFGTHDERALSVFVETARQLKPARIILNGDLPDLLAVSKYPKDARPKHTWNLRDEAAAMATFLRELEAAVPRETDIIETEANHSGNGTASRWWRYLSDNVPALMAHPKAEELLAYQAWWYPEWSRLRIQEEVIIANDLLVIHGEIVRKHGAYSARAHSEKYVSSVMHSHTHRVGFVGSRIPGLRGIRGEGVQRSYEIGCMCSLEPVYAKGVNWTQGFAIVTEGEGDGDYAADIITITEGRAVVGALGATLKAA